MKKVLSVMLALLLLVTCLPLGMVSVSAFSPSRDDGTWLFPLPKSYYNSFSDWAGCPGEGACLFCGVYHDGWGDTAHTGQGGHNGVDIAVGTAGVAPVYASAGGTAYFFENSNRGKTIVIEHVIGNGYSYYTYYQHLDSISVSNGAKVTVGQVIGKAGNTGASGGPHLHFGMAMGTSGQTGNNNLLNKLEKGGWITTAGYKTGRILNNPASSNDAGFPAGQSAVVAPLKTHYGSTHYTFDTSKVTIGSTPAPTAIGTYYIKNAGNGMYLDVANATDANKQNIQTVSFNGSNAQKYEITPSTTTAGYSMRPLSSATRMVNVYGDTVSSGKNVCIWDDTGDASQRWNFEKVSGGYVIRNVQNSSCVLDVESNGNVYVSTYTGAATQIWIFQDVNCVHTYDHACDSNCNKCGMWRSVSGHNWTSATCTAPATCTICGTTEGSALSHTWADATCTVAKTCTVCGTTEGDVSGHTWDADTGRCTICGETVSAEYSEWTEELPNDVTEDLFDIETKDVYRYRDNSSHVVYGDWSGEKTSTTKPAESDTLTIVSTKTYYNYYHYCCNYYGGTYNVDSILHGTGGQYHTIRLTYELTAKNVGDMGGKTLYGNYTCSKNFQVWAKADQYITYEYTYKTRTKTDVVDYGAWSEWADAEPSAAANRNVETKTLYRYKLKRVQTAYASDVQHSVMDTDKGNGLAFKFELTAKGVVKDKTNKVDLTDATVNYLGKECKLIAMGTVITNSAEFGEGGLTIEDVNDFNVVDVPTIYVQEAGEESCAFATRITNIPDDQLERVIYARPYYIVEVDGEQITVYGDVNTATCAEYM